MRCIGGGPIWRRMAGRTHAHRGFKAVLAAVYLGVDTAGGARIRLVGRRQRLRSLRGRLMRLRRLRQGGARPLRTLRATGLAQLAHGAAVHGVADSGIVAQRRPLGHFVGGGAGGRSTMLALFVSAPHGLDLMYAAALGPARAWLHALWNGLGQHQDMALPRPSKS